MERFVLCSHCQWAQHGVHSKERCNCQCHPARSRKARRRRPGGAGRRARVEQLLARDGNLCCWCKEKFTVGWPPTIEHWIPRSQGGSNRLSNLRLACSWCNGKRGDMAVAEFKVWLAKNIVPRSRRRNCSVPRRV